MSDKISTAQAGLAALVAHGFSIRSISRREADEAGMMSSFEAALRGKLLQSAGYEASVEAEDWLASPEGRAVIEAAS